MTHQIINGDCLEVLKTLPDNSVDSVVTDPPYGLSFMGKHWDYDVPGIETWKEVFRVLKPGGHLLSFFGSRTYHRGVIPIEDAGFEIRDQIMWVYGSGFPKSLNIGKAVDKIQGNEREVTGTHDTHDIRNNALMGRKGSMTVTETKGTSQYEGWGTALKPAHEPIVVARKPLSEKTVAENVLKHGTGGLNIDGCRVGTEDVLETGRNGRNVKSWKQTSELKNEPREYQKLGRWPANLIHDGSEEVLECFPNAKGCSHGSKGTGRNIPSKNVGLGGGQINCTYGDNGSAARFFYCAKASKKDRDEGLEGVLEEKARNERKEGGKLVLEVSGAKSRNFHPTVKPTALMRYLVKLVTPPGGTVLDPFTGSGSTGKACKLEGFDFIGIEREEEYVKIAEARIEAVNRVATLV